MVADSCAVAWLSDGVSAAHWHWQLSECLDALGLDASHTLLDSSSDARFGQALCDVAGCQKESCRAPPTLEGDVGPEQRLEHRIGFHRALLWNSEEWLSSPDRRSFVAQLRKLQPSTGARLVVSFRPHRKDELPLPETWRQRCPGCHASEEDLAADLRDAGYGNVTWRRSAYPCEVALTRWGTFLDTLRPSLGEDQTLQQDVQDFQRRLERPDGAEHYLHFQDTLTLLTAEVSGTEDGEPPTKRPRPASRQLPPALRLARDGFVAPFAVLLEAEASTALSRLDAHAAMVLGTETALAEDLDGEQRFKLHLLYPWAEKLVKHPKLLAAVRAALGSDDVLVWFSEVNAKAPFTDRHAAPHQDGIYASLAPDDHVVTAWLALTDSATEMGGLVFQRGSHLRGQLPHQVDEEVDNMIGFCRSDLGEQDLQEAVPVEHLAGEATLHTFRTLHWSGPNLSARRRVGLAIRYVAADVGRTRALKRRETAMVACGCYDPALGAFDVEPVPMADAGPAERAVHRDALAREEANYLAEAEDED